MATTMGPRLDQTAHRRGRGGRAGGGQRTLKLMMLRFAGRSLFPALSTARTTAWYLPRGREGVGLAAGEARAVREVPPGAALREQEDRPAALAAAAGQTAARREETA